MRFTDVLREDCIRPGLEAGEGAGVLGELAGMLAARSGAPRERLARLLTEREGLASTAIGEGVAIPHCRLEGVPGLMACVGVHPEGVDFGARDGKPVRLFVTVVSAPNLVGTHLSVLARIAALVRDEGLREAVLKARSETAIRELFARAEEAYLAGPHRPESLVANGP